MRKKLLCLSRLITCYLFYVCDHTLLFDILWSLFQCVQLIHSFVHSSFHQSVYSFLYIFNSIPSLIQSEFDDYEKGCILHSIGVNHQTLRGHYPLLINSFLSHFRVSLMTMRRVVSFTSPGSMTRPRERTSRNSSVIMELSSGSTLREDRQR